MPNAIINQLNSLSMKKKTSTARRKTTIIDSLPRDMLLSIVSLIASKSLTDLFNIKVCCKEFCKTAEDRYVYQSASLEKIPVIPWGDRKEEVKFVNNCKESGNPEALYRQGFIDFFFKEPNESRIANLKKAAENGHIDATYVYGIILFCESGIEERKQGLKILSNCFDSKMMLKETKERIRRVMNSMWIYNGIVHERVHGGNCDSKKGTTVKEDSDLWFGGEENNITCCELCLWKYEAHLFCNVLLIKAWHHRPETVIAQVGRAS